MAQGAVNRLVVIGGSAGSLEVLLQLLPDLPVQTDACYVVVVHRRADADSLLPGLLAGKTTMPVKEVEDKEAIYPNTVYVAPADYHLLVEDPHSFSLDSSEKVHYSRPSIDVTFESAAEAFGSAVVGVLLSGANADGAAGLKRIRQAGGITAVQDPATAEVGYMPQQAVKAAAAEAILPVAELAGFVAQTLKHNRRENAGGDTGLA